MQTMKAVRIHNYGGPEVLKFKDAPRPQVATGEGTAHSCLWCGGKACGLENTGGSPKGLPHLFISIDPGMDVSGTVDVIGSGVTRFREGDEVFSRPDIARNGAYAEYIAVRESEVAFKPKSLDHLHAAAIPLAGLTAWKGIFDTGGLSAGRGF